MWIHLKDEYTFTQGLKVEVLNGLVWPGTGLSKPIIVSWLFLLGRETVTDQVQENKACWTRTRLAHFLAELAQNRPKIIWGPVGIVIDLKVLQNRLKLPNILQING